jgi:hypothetical protein
MAGDKGELKRRADDGALTSRAGTVFYFWLTSSSGSSTAAFYDGTGNGDKLLMTLVAGTLTSDQRALPAGQKIGTGVYVDVTGTLLEAGVQQG